MVYLKREPGCIGIIKHIDTNLPDNTTCNVEWIVQNGVDYEEIDDPTEWDIQWTQKLCLMQ